MIEVHCVNAWLDPRWVPDWLHFINGLVAPSFILCAGYSLALSTFRSDGSLRPFKPTAGRLGFILICAYLLHAPGFTLVEWTLLSTPQKFRELFKIDVLQCIVYSLLILQGLARLIRRPRIFAAVALVLAVGVAWAAPHLWRPGVGDGVWLPLRGLINGNPQAGVTAMFPLFPWLAFAAFGAVLGAAYRELRVLSRDGLARWSEARWLLLLGVLGLVLLLWGSWQARTWLWNGPWSSSDMGRLHNTTLPSVAQRLGLVCMAGAFLGWFESVRGTWPGPQAVQAASRESLLLYMLHLNLLYATGLSMLRMTWGPALAGTALMILVNLGAGVAWQRVRGIPGRAWKLQRVGLWVLAAFFFLGGWMTYHHFHRSPELAVEPYRFLNAARIRKGLPPTPDGLSRDPMEGIREKLRLHGKLNAHERQLLESQRDRSGK